MKRNFITGSLLMGLSLTASVSLAEIGYERPPTHCNISGCEYEGNVSRRKLRQHGVQLGLRIGSWITSDILLRKLNYTKIEAIMRRTRLSRKKT